MLTLAECGPLGVAALLWLLWRLLRLALAVRWSGGASDVEATALGVGFTVAVLSMALGNVYGTPFLDGLVMGKLLDPVRAAGALRVAQAPCRHGCRNGRRAAWKSASPSRIGERFPLAAQICARALPSAPK